MKLITNLNLRRTKVLCTNFFVKAQADLVTVFLQGVFSSVSWLVDQDKKSFLPNLFDELGQTKKQTSKVVFKFSQ